MTDMPQDPIVAEIRSIRSELAERFGNDVNALCDFLTEQEQQHQDRLVNYSPKLPQYVRTASADG
jgi:hypothetical protein